MNPVNEERMAAREQYVYQDGKRIFKRAVNGMSSTISEVMQRNNLVNDDIRWVVPHQANLRIIHAVAKTLAVPLEKIFVNVRDFGNTGSASVPAPVI